MDFQHWNRESEKGFTLIEVMVTIAILGILIATASPGISSLLPNYRLKSATQDLFTNMQSAKMQAIKANSNYTITFDAINDSYNLNGTKNIVLTEYKSGVCYGHPSSSSEIEYTSNSVSFTSRGMTTQNPTTWTYVYLKNNRGRYYRIGTLSTGLVRIQRWNGSSFE